MANKRAPKGGNQTVDFSNIGQVDDRSIVPEMEKSYLEYSMSVIVARALPDVRDGMKPVHRRILHVMDRMNLTQGSKYRKSATVVGEVMGKFHPHGDSAIYDSMARMAQWFSMRYELVDGQGNFGSMDGDPPAAMRYTEARMTRMAGEMLADLDKETVDWRPNYDGSEQEPSVLPARVPNLLLNGQIGIAVGMATNIPPHNLSELVDAVVHMIDHDETTIDDLLQYVKGPDFPTGAMVYGKESLRQAYGTGRGGVVVRAVAEIEEGNRGTSRILVSEIPYGVNKANLVEKIADLVRDKKITGISDLRDESSRGSVRIVVDLKKDAYPKKVLNQLFKLTPLQQTFHFNMLALVDGIQPRVMGLETMLREYLKHRQLVIRRRCEYELRKAKERAHVLEGLKIALDHIDEVIATIRASQTSDEAQANLIKKFDLTEIQARAILAMQLRTLAGLERQKIEDELKQLLERISELEKILASESEILRIVKEELLEVKDKYGDERRTQIIPQELGKFSDEELIPNEEAVVTFTKGSYIKRTTLDTYKTQGRGGKGLVGMGTKEEDVIEHLLFTNTHDYLLFFTNQGRVFRIKAYEIPAASRNAKGQAVVNLLQLHPDERVTSIIRLDENDGAKGYLMMATRKGTVKKTELKQYANVRASGLISIKLDDGDELSWVRWTSGEDEIIITTALGQGLRFKESDVRPMGRATRGVRGIRLRSGDQVVGMDVVDQKAVLVIVTEKGFGKRTKVANFATYGRGSLGIKASTVNEKTGKVVAVKTLIDPEDQIMFVSQKGQLIRIKASGITIIGRATQGVRIMKLKAGDSVASMALIHSLGEVEEEGDEAEDKKAKPAKASKKEDGIDKAGGEEESTEE